VQLDGLREIHFRPERVLASAMVEVECVRGSPGRDAHRQFVEEVAVRSLSALADGVYLVQGAGWQPDPKHIYTSCELAEPHHANKTRHPLSFLVHCDEHPLRVHLRESLSNSATTFEFSNIFEHLRIGPI
jgi:hypothetical protein